MFTKDNFNYKIDPQEFKVMRHAWIILDETEPDGLVVLRVELDFPIAFFNSMNKRVESQFFLLTMGASGFITMIAADDEFFSKVGGGAVYGYFTDSGLNLYDFLERHNILIAE